MMDWTDRHCRVFHRTISRQALLYTEMVTSPAVIHGERDRLLGFDDVEHPLAVQLGGSDPAELAEATRIVTDYGYAEVNLNVGCPSDRVQSGCFGAVLMERPELVAECVAAMAAATHLPVTVKCRLGVDDQDPAQALPALLQAVQDAGTRHVIIHARKAWLQGLSARENREIPPLDHSLALSMKQAFPALTISVNGGIATLGQAEAMLARGFDGVMVGRAAYHEPLAILGQADARIFGAPDLGHDAFSILEAMRPYIGRHLASGGRLHKITRHMLGLFHGQPGARSWRRILSERANAPDAGFDVLDAALAEVTPTRIAGAA